MLAPAHATPLDPAVIPLRAPAALDPIHAAIERHRAAYLAWCLAGIPDFDQPHSGEGHDPAVRRKCNRAHGAMTRAGMALTTTQPTTLAGVVALFAYVAEFNAGSVKLPGERGLSWMSNPDGWPHVPGDNVDADQFPYLLIENARSAIENITKGDA